MSAVVDAKHNNHTSRRSKDGREGATALRIGLINNMPDAAVERTERQFDGLLRAAAGDLAVRTEYYSLPEIPRSVTTSRQMALSYRSVAGLRYDRPDALVVTGTEPREKDLRDEVYWSALGGLIDWIDQQGIPAIFSCLAAHAAVLHMDGVSRRALDDKRFGIFDHDVLPGHPLTESVGSCMPLPHTRWNEVTEPALLRAGYQILTRSRDAGVGFFAKQGRGHWLFCQGHPEYDADNLTREYRRDVARFLTGERATYPEMPEHYFEEAEVRLLNAFRHQAMLRPDPSAMEMFPRIASRQEGQGCWHAQAVRVFGNWLRQVANVADTASEVVSWEFLSSAG